MKVRVKETGKIVDVRAAERGRMYCDYDFIDSEGLQYDADELEYDADELEYDPDYWARLEHTYAGMVMQGMLSGKWVELMYLVVSNDGEYRDLLTNKAQELAHALVEKYKEKEE